MQFEFWNRNPPASLNDVKRVELRVGATIPEAYRNFILNENGGEPKCVEYPIPDLGTSSDVNTFFAFGDGAEIEMAIEELTQSGESVHQIVPVGCDGYGNLILLDLRNGREEVLYWDRLRDFSQSNENYDCYVIAYSFARFLTILQPIRNDA